MTHQLPLTENGQPRVPDDFQPRANIKKMFSDGMLTTEEELQQFSEKLAVEPHLIKAYIAHLEDLKIQSGIRTRGRAEQKRKMMSKTFEEYAWRDLVESGDLKKLLVSELNKYLKHYKLVSSGTKAEKIRRVSLHVLRGNHGQQEDTNEFTDEETKECGTEDDSEEIDSSGDDESEEDIVLAELLSGPDSDQDTIATSSRERERYSIDESEKIWFVFQSDSDEEEFYGFD